MHHPFSKVTHSIDLCDVHTKVFYLFDILGSTWLFCEGVHFRLNL